MVKTNSVFCEKVKTKILVFGGSKGLGLTIARLLVNRGDDVVTVARSAPPKELRINHWPCDLLKINKIQKSMEYLRKKQGPFEGIVFSARFRGKARKTSGFFKMDLEACHEVLKFCPGLFGNKPGSVVLIGSTAAQGVAPEQGPEYHAAKAGLLGLMRYYAFHLARKGIRVNVVSPGTFVKNEWTEQKISPRLRKIQQANPFHRLGQDNEVAEACVFLLEKKSSWITGQELVVDGGAGLVCNESMVAMKRTDKRTN